MDFKLGLIISISYYLFDGEIGIIKKKIEEFVTIFCHIMSDLHVGLYI